MTRRPTTRLRLTNLEDRLTPAGGLDPTFGAGGFVVSPFGNYDSPASVLAQPDGHILVLTNAYERGGTQVTRYNADGSLDTAFGVGGTVSNLVPGRTANVGNAVVGPDGKITLTGRMDFTRPAVPGMFVTMDMVHTSTIVRLNADGTPDSGFGTDGVASIDAALRRNSAQLYSPMGSDAEYAGDLLADGSLVVTITGFFSGIKAVRLTPSGAVDPGFGVNGLFDDAATGNIGWQTTYTAATPDGGLLVMRPQNTYDNYEPVSTALTFLKLTATGALDPAFDGDGVLTMPLGVPGGSLDLVAQPDGKLLVATTRSAGYLGLQPSSVEVWRLNADGSLDASFGGDGRVEALPDGGYAGTGSLDLLPDGRIVVASGSYFAFGTGFAVLNADGTPDDYFADGSGVGGLTYGVDTDSDGSRPSFGVGGVAVAGDRVVVLSSITGSDYWTSRQNRLGLAVLTEGPGAIPLPLPVIVLPPELPVIVTPPELPVVGTPPGGSNPEPETVIVAPPGGSIPDVPPGDATEPVVATPTVVPPQPGLTLEELAYTTGVAPQPVADPIPPPFDPRTPTLPRSGPRPPIALPSPVPVENDFNGDGFADKVVTAGSKVSVVSGSDGTVLLKAFAPFEASYTGTLNAVFVDVDGNGQDELVVSPGMGGGPVVAVYNADGTERGRFWGIEDASFRGGVNLAAGDTNGDGMPDLIVTAGQGGGPRVAIFEGTTLGAGARRLVADFFAFEATQTGGATAGVANGLLIFGAGPGGGPRVRGIDSRSLYAAVGVRSLDDLPAGAQRFDRFIGDASSRLGVTLELLGVGSLENGEPSYVTARVGDGPAVVVYENPGAPRA